MLARKKIVNIGQLDAISSILRSLQSTENSGVFNRQ